MLQHYLSKIQSGEFIRFLAVAALQAIANYGTYIIVLQFAPWQFAFACAVVVGIALQTILQFKATFRRPLTGRAGSVYFVYQLLYLAVFFLLMTAAIGLGIPAWAAPLVVIAVITVPNFLLSRWLISQ